VRYLVAVLAAFSFLQPNLYSYSVLTHEAIIDTAWKDSIEPLLRQRFPRASAPDLKKAHAYAYGGSIIQDMGYYPFGAHFFTDLTHYVRSGDFITSMMRNAANLDEYAFSLGALAHYASDANGHAIAINRAVPMLYPKLKREYGDEVTFSDDPASHLKTEFGFDVLQVAKGRYPSDAYHDFIGFEVSKALLERSFRETYGLELKDVFDALDLAIGTYRKTVSGLIPKMTKVAWTIKKDDIAKSQPGITREKFLYNLSRVEYEKDWGREYMRPGLGSRVLAFVIRIVPKIGPLRSLSFRTPTPATEKLFMESFNATLERYKGFLTAERTRRTNPADVNLDVGKPTIAGMYKLADETYMKLIDKLTEHDFSGMPRGLHDDILNFYKNQPVAVSPDNDKKHSAKLQRQLEMLRATAAYSTP
jgi:Zinc dependent phospholipase C